MTTPVTEIPVQDAPGGFAALLQDPMIAQALLTAGSGMASGQNPGQAIQSGLGVYQKLMQDKKSQARLDDQTKREDKRLALETRRADTAATQGSRRLDIAEGSARTERARLGIQKEAALANATTAAERAAIEARYKEAQIGKLTAETSKLEATAETELTGTDPKLWEEARNTVLESTGIGEKPSVRSVAAMYNTMAPEGKQVKLPFSSSDLKQALESSANSGLETDEQVSIIKANFGEKAAQRFSAALKKMEDLEAKQEVSPENTSLFKSIFGD